MSEQNASPEVDASSKFEDSLPTTSLAIMAHLDTSGFSYTLHEHPPLRTVEDSQNLRGEMTGGHIKTFIFATKRRTTISLLLKKTKILTLKHWVKLLVLRAFPLALQTA